MIVSITPRWRRARIQIAKLSAAERVAAASCVIDHADMGRDDSPPFDAGFAR
jgi:hypothetical protein